ncbi:MAG: GIY-YIG nuclease family protein [Gemmatimonadota bacterium]
MRSLDVYILASRSRVLYTGVPNDLQRRMREHRKKRPGSCTARYLSQSEVA